MGQQKIRFSGQIDTPGVHCSYIEGGPKFVLIGTLWGPNFECIVNVHLKVFTSGHPECQGAWNPSAVAQLKRLGSMLARHTGGGGEHHHPEVVPEALCLPDARQCCTI